MISFGVIAGALLLSFWWFKGVAFGIDGPINEHKGLQWRKVRRFVQPAVRDFGLLIFLRLFFFFRLGISTIDLWRVCVGEVVFSLFFLGGGVVVDVFFFLGLFIFSMSRPLKSIPYQQVHRPPLHLPIPVHLLPLIPKFTPLARALLVL